MSGRTFLVGVVAVGLVMSACAGDAAPISSTDGRGQGGSSDEEEAMDDGAVGEDEPAASSALGTLAEAWIGDGTLDTVDLVEVYAAPDDLFCDNVGCRPGVPVDLEFNPARDGELWVLFRQPYSGELCEQANPSSLGCRLMASKVVVITEAGGEAPRATVKEDGNAWHFMRVATALAFADDDSFATVGEVRTGNYMDNPADYMGPTWWSSDPAIFAVDFGEDANGSHLDMLHATPFGMGIAHDPSVWEANNGNFATGPVFWAFNGQIGSIDRYDFKAPHMPGGADHSDGTLHRYVTGQLRMLPGVPAHMEFASVGRTSAPAGGFGEVQRNSSGERLDLRLYIADSGNNRVVRLDPSTGTFGGTFETPDSDIAAPTWVDDVVLAEVVGAGVMAAPSGIAVADELLFVSDAHRGNIHVFDLGGKPLGMLETGLGEWSLAGLATGPDDKLYFVDWNGGRVLRVEPM
jgi:outer membrane protein assembly factor BamB